MTNRSTYLLHDSLGYQLSRTARTIEQGFDEALKELGLTRTIWCVLMACGQEGLSRPSEIAAHIGIDRTAASRALRRMETDGLIRRQTGTEDKRTTTVKLTGRGRELLAASLPHARHNAKRFEAKLTSAEAGELRRLLQRLREDEPSALRRL